MRVDNYLLSKLFLHTSAGHTTDYIREIALRLKKKGLIDGVGVQMHIDASKPFDENDIIKTFQSYGMEIYITELDIDQTNVTEANKLITGANNYRIIVEACIKSKVCKGITFWESPGDQFNWLEDYLNKPGADGTIYSNSLNPKPSYFAFKEALSNP